LAVRADNPAAIALYRKFGFRDEGLLRVAPTATAHTRTAWP
jgi:ribosomal protein S18 acetylase RimI-like enzyme